MDRDILEQYIELREEVKDLRGRIDRDEHRLRKIEKEGLVSDTVKGSRNDESYAYRSVKITGYPIPEVSQVKSMIRKRVMKLHILEDELQEAVNAVDGFINDIPKSDLRMIFRLRYLDDRTWAAVAINMNHHFPKRRIKYTEDNCRIRHDRYLKEKFGNL